VKASIDELLDLPDEKKVQVHPDEFSVCVAYQHPVKLSLVAGTNDVEVLARTFEDALVFENLPFFRATQATEEIGKVRDIVAQAANAADLSTAMHELLKKISKAAFALDILFSEDPKDLQVPTYIKTGFHWLQQQLEHKEKDQTPSPGPAMKQPGLDDAA
jgi:hypothetical protein